MRAVLSSLSARGRSGACIYSALLSIQGTNAGPVEAVGLDLICGRACAHFAFVMPRACTFIAQRARVCIARREGHGVYESVLATETLKRKPIAEVVQ